MAVLGILGWFPWNGEKGLVSVLCGACSPTSRAWARIVHKVGNFNLFHFLTGNVEIGTVPLECRLQFVVYKNLGLYNQVAKEGQVQTRVPLLHFTPFLLRFFHCLFKFTFTFLFDFCINFRLVNARMILCVSPVYHPHGP